MFGYVQVNQKELKVKEFDLYRSYYCGICHILKKRYGRTGQLLLNYDMTFLALLLSGLYEPPEQYGRGRCVVHPLRRHESRVTDASAYAADMTVLLAYEKAGDDVRDEKSAKGLVLGKLLKRHYRRVSAAYPRQAAQLRSCMKELAQAEKDHVTDPDKVAGITGRFLAEIFVWKDDIWQDDLRQIGFYLGKFIYLMDAWEDLEKDEKSGSYNLLPALREKDPAHFEENVRQMLEDMMTECARAFERLPVIENAGILRNILYSGVWSRYAQIREKRMKERADQVKAYEGMHGPDENA